MSILTEPIHTIRGDETSLAAFDGKSILAVNVASKCGLTGLSLVSGRPVSDLGATNFSGLRR